MKKIALLTSGGDAPGMNAHIRAIVRTCLARGIEPVGVFNGFQGLMDGNYVSMNRKSTINLIDQGGTILKTSRSEEFRSKEGRQKAFENLCKYDIDGLITCGGDGTFHGAHALSNEFGVKVVGTPGTIDNDLFGTYYTIGYDTAINTATEAIDRIRDTADSHGRVFIIEVMGRHAGHIAIDVGISCGAEYIMVPEKADDILDLQKKIEMMGDHTRTIIIVGEGGQYGGANELAVRLKINFGIDAKTTILGHIQRGGSPTVKDRVLASHLGMASVDALLSGKTDVMVGRIYHEITYTPLVETWEKKKNIQDYLFNLADILA
ncbi:ATP-dependent 6-phosphofructokinase [Candidatus Kapabacteria bacterium]|nr:ATP-dependent 6-phosphofructokinase [Candidatus Kapabacteria bacterium]